MWLRTRALALVATDLLCWVAAVVAAVALRYDLAMPPTLARATVGTGMVAGLLFVVTGLGLGLALCGEAPAPVVTRSCAN